MVDARVSEELSRGNVNVLFLVNTLKPALIYLYFKAKYRRFEILAEYKQIKNLFCISCKKD